MLSARLCHAFLFLLFRWENSIPITMAAEVHIQVFASLRCGLSTVSWYTMIIRYEVTDSIFAKRSPDAFLRFDMTPWPVPAPSWLGGAIDLLAILKHIASKTLVLKVSLHLLRIYLWASRHWLVVNLTFDTLHCVLPAILRAERGGRPLWLELKHIPNVLVVMLSWELLLRGGRHDKARLLN